MDFEWDDKKDKLNRVKHNLSFTEAAHIFLSSAPLLTYETYDKNGVVRNGLSLLVN
jgi:uncharacterized DUF497 family protein